MTTALAGWGGGGGKAGRAEKSAQEKRPLPAFPAWELVGPESAGSGFRKRAYNHGDLQLLHRDPLLAVPGQQRVVPGDQLVGAVGEVRCTLSQNGYGLPWRGRKTKRQGSSTGAANRYHLCENR